MNKTCIQCSREFTKRSTTSVKNWGKSKYCSVECRKLNQSPLIIERLKTQNAKNIGKMRFNGKTYTKEYLENNVELVAQIKQFRKEKQKSIRSEKLKQYRMENPITQKRLKSEEDKKLWQKEYRKRNSNKLKMYSQTDNSKFRQYISSAKKRKYEFDLTLELFTKLFHSSCTYCGQEDCRGIDRVDNKIGYTKENSVACCEVCNKMKWKLDVNDFLSQINKIASFKNLST